MSNDHGFEGDICPVCGMTRASLQPGGENYGRTCIKPLAAATREAGYDSFASEDEIDNIAAAKDRGADDARLNRIPTRPR